MSEAEDTRSRTGRWRAVRWPIALEAPPTIVAAGTGIHGFFGAERYLLPDLWCLHLYTYACTLRLGELTLPVRPGCVGLTPPNTPAEYDFTGPSHHLYVHFRVAAAPRAAAEQRSIVHIAAMQPLGDDFARFYAAAEGMVRHGGGGGNRRAEARLWDLLYELAERAGDEEGTGACTAVVHPAVRRSVATIELRLGEPLSVEALAAQAGVSYSYLARLFQEAYGVSVVGYIRARRVDRARHLLQSTTLPIKVVAAQVGLGDLQAFNKALRRHLGQSPRQVRDAAVSTPRENGD